MNVNISTPNFQGKLPTRKLVPASKLQGLKLQLTEAEASRIQDLENQIVTIKEEVLQKKKFLKRRKYSPIYTQQVKNEVAEQKNIMNMLQETIRNIKVNRFTEQKRAAGLNVSV